MSLKAQARKRLMILGGGALMIAVVVGGVFVYRHERTLARFADIRTRGLKGADEGRPDLAIVMLSQYLRRYPSDTQVMAVYIHSLLKSRSDPTNLEQARRWLVNLLRIEPARPDEWRDLMHLYKLGDMQTEANDAADNLLKYKDKDGEALYTKADALYRMKRYKESQDAADKRLAVTPTDWTTQIIALRDMKELGGRNTDLVKRAADLAKVYPKEQGAMLTQAIAFQLTNDYTNAQQALITAAALPPSMDTNVGGLLIRMLDFAGLHVQSLAVLKGYADSGNVAAERAMLRRYWENRQMSDAIGLYATASTRPSPPDANTLINTDPAGPLSDAESLGIYADCLRRANRADDAAKVLNQLKNRPATDILAKAWALIESPPSDSSVEDAKALRAACAAASEHYPADPYLLYYEAEAYGTLGEIDAAVNMWHNCQKYSLTWVTPLVESGEALLSLGRPEAAQADADVAFGRYSGSTAVAILHAMVWFAEIQEGGHDTLVDNLDLLNSEIQAAAPGEEESLRIHIALEARKGDLDAAKQDIQAVLDQKPLPGFAKLPMAAAPGAPPATAHKPSTKLLIALAGLSSQNKLNLETDCMTEYEKLYGRTPESALRLALQAFVDSKGQQGMQMLQDSINSAKGRDAIGFRMAMASYLETTLAPDRSNPNVDPARDAWKKLGNDYPNELAVQRACMVSSAAYRDRDFYNQTIDRVHAILGDDATSWKLARARWVLEGSMDAKSTNDATAVLKDALRRDPDSVGGHILMAQAEERAGDLAGATAELNMAQRLDPNAPGLSVDLAKLYQVRGDFTGAKEQLQIAVKQQKSPGQLYDTGMMFAAQGDIQAAINIIEPLTSDAKAPESFKVGLISLYCRTKEFAKAQALCDQLMMKPDALSIITSAQVQMFQRHPTEAEALLTRLNDLKDLPPGNAQQLQGDFRYVFGQLDVAETLYRQAIIADPNSSIYWMSLIDTEMLLGHATQALADTAEAAKHIPNDAQIRAVAAQSDLINKMVDKIGDGATQRRLLSALIKDPSPNGPAVTTLHTTMDLALSNDTADQVLAGLTKLANDWPRFLPAQTALIESQIRLGRCAEAVISANRVTKAFPTEFQPAQLAANALEAVNRWDEALQMSLIWRDRIVGDPLDVDVQIAQIQLHQNDPAGAIATLKPHLDAAFLTEDQKWHLNILEAAAMVRMGNPDGAAQLLWPAAQSTPSVRQEWMDFISVSLPLNKSPQWLEKMAAQLKTEPNSGANQLALARTWDALGSRTNNRQYLKNARDIAQGLQASSDPTESATAYFFSGIFAEESADFPTAEADYRIAAKGNISDARNNLAMLLVNHGGDLKEATNLALQITKDNPHKGTYFDTLASVLEKSMDFAGASAAMQQALDMEPNNARWHVNGARLLYQAGKYDQAKQLVAELDLMSPGVSSLDKVYAAKLVTLRKQISDATTRPSHQY